MNTTRFVHIVAPLIVVVCLAASGTLLPRILDESQANALRYTNVSVQNVPPFVAVGTMIGAIRGIIVDYLWIKVHWMKDKGLFYEVMADSELITKLQPRFAEVWSFLGHNMAYNISVATHTKQERWEWVQAGIHLVRDEGLRYNPNDLNLHRELAFFFAHKIEGVADDAHLYYKQQLAREWHLLLGEPPDDHAQRIAWMQKVADAPETLDAAIKLAPAITELSEKLKSSMPTDDPRIKFELDSSFVRRHTIWQAVTQQSAMAKAMGLEARYSRDPAFSVMNDLARDPKYAEAWDVLLAHLRKRTLADDYNMDPRLMAEYMKLGPIDWRNGQAHALYWARRGSEFGRGRVSNYDVYEVLNNDSQQIQAMQDLARYGRMSVDIFSDELPTRFPDPRWIDAIDSVWQDMYIKHINVRGAGGERFINFIQNFMSSAICEWYRAGETEKAQKLLDSMDALFGTGRKGLQPNPIWSRPLDVFVQDETFDQYQAQPHLAPRDVWASLRYGLIAGVIDDRPKVLEDSLIFAKQVTDYYKGNSYNDYVTKLGEGRMADLLAELDDSLESSFLLLMTDPQIDWDRRRVIWSNVDRVESEAQSKVKRERVPPTLRALVYDRIRPALEQQLAASQLGRSFKVDELFPPPPGLEQAREVLAQRKKKREEQQAEIRKRDPISRTS